jgi:branched-subunit amino acid ABC-type transport system permease component
MLNLGPYLFNSVVTGSFYLLSAVALTLTYGLSRFPNFAHAEFMTLGAYIGFALSVQLGLPFGLSIVCAFIGSGLLGVACYKGIFAPLSKRGASLIHLMIASLALGIIIRYIIAQIWTGAAQSFSIVFPTYHLGTWGVYSEYLLRIAAALIAGVSMHIILTRTQVGRAIRATSSNPQLAQASGINTGLVLLTTWFLSAGLAGIAGLLLVAPVSISPLSGWNILLPVFAVTVLGGIGSFYGAIVAAFIIGLAENFGVLILTQVGLSTEYRSAISFVILIVVLLIKPQGLTRLFKGN